MTKAEARIYQKNRILKIENRQQKENLICERLTQRLIGAKRVIGYRADQFEVNIDSVWKDKRLDSIDFYFPRVVSKEKRILEFVKPIGWETGAYGLEEPVGMDLILPQEADLILVPSLGFHQNGFRLGRGAGFYDRAFREGSTKKMIGILFSELFSIDFPYSDYDIRVGELVTESTVLFL
ncbi:MAG TPA: 5-formyltetrahydrofolate cyclo-ligase [Leptospiraceae bacterium]|nr:5-formyltetrahydrofolate cyclo-ligase [Leptospiraceae bacterium]HMW04376.1 5-formyltetrahydrofolate cyclo-ligase [Leptospiraceae bacterium]HMX31054.1 5-formyltetrahydrofolate cyclo-ligase [Leptospiraceae bacterium]HMY31870.1 5-formyltetrahydrofolate cyclo-ligase [Leptospiraceae bacterium]HMZ63859.1 5-formyltetrahydrofolate cyclo-ligase [Leptospiraceae bacterium]